MHYRYKVLANRFPLYRPWFVYINHCVRSGYRQFKADQLARSVGRCLEQDSVSIYELTRVLTYMEQEGLVDSKTMIIRLEDDHTIGTVDSFAQLDSVYQGRTILLDKSTEHDQLSKPTNQYAYLSAMYTFKDLYKDRLINRY